MRLQVQGDTLRISLNDQLIHQHAIELEPNQRTFGLFHYADQSDLRVRNPSWQGEWPKALPELEQQELAVYANGFLEERSGDLTQVIQYRLDDKSLASRRFRVIEGNAISNVRPTSQGLILSRDGSDGYTGAMIAPNVRVGGDFDLTVALDQFACLRPHLGKIGSTRVLVLNEQGDMALIQAAWWIGSTTKRFSAGRWRPSMRMSVDTTSRLSRWMQLPDEFVSVDVGQDVRTLIAENDSNQFRLLGEQEYPADDVPDLGTRFGVQIQGSAVAPRLASPSLSFCAERLEGLATEDPDILLARLNTEREQLPVSFAHDFSRKEPDEDTDFYRWTDHDPWEASACGLQIDAPGSNEWTYARDRSAGPLLW